jgi:hypothetical protein
MQKKKTYDPRHSKEIKMPKSDGLNPRESDDLEKIDSGKAKTSKYTDVN